MPELSRRMFLSSGAGAAAAGVAIAAVPGLASVATLDDRSVATATIEELQAAGPLVVHVRDAAAGEISVMSGEHEVVFNDPSFIARIVAAANGRTA